MTEKFHHPGSAARSFRYEVNQPRSDRWRTNRLRSKHHYPECGTYFPLPLLCQVIRGSIRCGRRHTAHVVKKCHGISFVDGGPEAARTLNSDSKPDVHEGDTIFRQWKPATGRFFLTAFVKKQTRWLTDKLYWAEVNGIHSPFLLRMAPASSTLKFFTWGCPIAPELITHTF